MTKLEFVDIPEMVLPEKMKDFYCVDKDLQKLIEEFNSKIRKFNKSKGIKEIEELNEFYEKIKIKYFDKIELNKAAVLEMFDGDENKFLEFLMSDDMKEVSKEFMFNKIIEKTKKQLNTEELQDTIINVIKKEVEELLNNKEVLKDVLKEGFDVIPKGGKAGFQITERKMLVNKKGKRFSSLNNNFLEEYGVMIWESIKGIDINLIKNRDMIAAYEDSKK